MQRQKQIDITDEMVAQIEAVTNTTVDRDNIVVYEAVAASTRPVNKYGSIFNGAVMSRQLLEEMAAGVNRNEHSVPLHTLHQNHEELPVGRVFQAYLVDQPGDGSTNLITKFYLPKSERELIDKIDLAVLDEVSVGMKSKQALCSKCGFDFFGPDADFAHLFLQSCENDHVIGKDGMHLKMTGLDYWAELSLVSRGASNKPKILSRARNTISQEAVDRIAASGSPIEATLLITSPTEMECSMPDPDPTPTPEPTPTPPEAVTPEEGLQAAIQGLTDRLEALEAQITEPEPEPEPEPEVEDLRTQLAAAQARLTELEAAEPEPEVVPLEPAPDLPVGGLAATSITDAQSKGVVDLRAAAFKTRKRK